MSQSLMQNMQDWTPFNPLSSLSLYVTLSLPCIPSQAHPSFSAAVRRTLGGAALGSKLQGPSSRPRRSNPGLPIPSPILAHALRAVAFLPGGRTEGWRGLLRLRVTRYLIVIDGPLFLSGPANARHQIMKILGTGLDSTVCPGDLVGVGGCCSTEQDMRGVGHSRCATCVNWRTWIFPARSYVDDRQRRGTRKERRKSKPEILNKASYKIRAYIRTLFRSPLPVSLAQAPFHSRLGARPIVLTDCTAVYKSFRDQDEI